MAVVCTLGSPFTYSVSLISTGRIDKAGVITAHFTDLNTKAREGEGPNQGYIMKQWQSQDKPLGLKAFTFFSNPKLMAASKEHSQCAEKVCSGVPQGSALDLILLRWPLNTIR